jgi:hypothetical protein
MPQRLLKADFATKLNLFLFYGFVFLGRIFVFVGLPVSIIFFLDRRVLFDRMFGALTRRGPLSYLAWALLLSTMYGILEVVNGFVSGYNLLTVFEVFVYNVCPWYVFLGIWAGTRRPDLVLKYVKFLAWFHAIITPLYFVVFRNATDVGWFPRPNSGSIVLLGLFCFEQRLARYWFPIAVCSFDTIANQIRADWLGLVIVLVIWGVATKKIGRIFTIAGVLTALMVVGFVADVRLPPIPGRGGELSARDTIGRAASGIDPEFAKEYSTNAGTYAGTIKWRENWWKAIREKVSEKYSTVVFGMGYGYPIADLVPYLKGFDIRTPHSMFYFNLAYGGAVGVALFFFLEASLLVVLWRVYKHTGQIFGFTMLSYFLVGSFFGNFFESPQSSAPTYLLVGMCIGPLFLPRPTSQMMGDHARAGTRPPARTEAPVIRGEVRPGRHLNEAMNCDAH